MFSRLIRSTRSVAAVKQITSLAEFDSVTRGAAIVDFYADWCGPCKRIAPTFEAMSEKFPNVTFAKVNIDAAELGPAIQQAEIAAVPTFIAFKDGKPVKVVRGADMNELNSAINLVSPAK